jgi:sodium-dependent dicarboxylate transporter 2/3/5
MLQGKTLLVLAGPLTGILFTIWLQSSGQSFELSAMAGVAIWMAIWWIGEAVSIYLTALIPAFALPFLGILNMSEVAGAFLPQITFLFIGGFLMAFAMEKWNLHKRIALKIILSIGSSPSRLLFGSMFASYFLSMWILNTATVMVLLPAILAVATQLNSEGLKLNTPLLLGLAFASSIGGISTLIGTAPNLYFADFFAGTSGGFEMSFLQWFLFAFPLSMVLFFFCFWLIRRMYLKSYKGSEIPLSAIRHEYESLGKFSPQEWRIGIAFLILIVAWFTGKDVQFGDFRFTGWIELIGKQGFVKESTVAIFIACTLFLIPGNKDSKLLEWRDAERIPFGVIFLFGGGFALAKGIQVSGLSEFIGSNLDFVSEFPLWMAILGMALFMTFFTEITSNTASIVLVLPLLAAIGPSLNYPILLLMLPTTVAASCAFMLPIATPPNTIVFGSDQLKIRDMVRTGLWLNLFCAVLISVYCLLFGDWLL